VHMADNIAAIWEPIVQTMWDPQHLTTLKASAVCFSAFGTHISYELSKPQGLVRLGGLDKLKKFIHLIGSRNRVLPACSIVP
jgi:hypothetical protein